MAVMTMERPTSEDDDYQLSDHERRERAAVMRAIHDKIDAPPGWRVEIIEGEIVVSPAPAPAHGYIVEIIRTAVGRSLPETHAAYENIGFAEPEDDIYIPDVSVWPRELLRGLASRPDAAECTLVVEITSPGQARHDCLKAAGYARCSIPVYLLVDRRRQRYVVYSEPEGGEYQGKDEVRFGKPVTLPLDPPVTVPTDDF